MSKLWPNNKILLTVTTTTTTTTITNTCNYYYYYYYCYYYYVALSPVITNDNKNFCKKWSWNFALQLPGGIYRQNREFPGWARQGFAGLLSLNEFYVLTRYWLRVLYSGSRFLVPSMLYTKMAHGLSFPDSRNGL